MKPRGGRGRSNPDVGVLALEFAIARGLRWPSLGPVRPAGAAGRVRAAEGFPPAAGARAQAAPRSESPAIAAARGARTERANEAALIVRAQAGDEPAFRALVEAHADRALALGLRILRSPADAEEAAQDAFVRAWRALPAFRGDAAFGTWLHRIVVRVALDRAAVLRTRRERERPAEAAPEPAAPAAAPDDAARARARRLEQLMAGLPAVQRAALTLYYWHDRSVDEVAAALSMPANTVKTHLSRARAALRAAWTAED